MEHIFKPLIIFFFFIYFTISYAATDSLQNPDFEIPPPNITLNNVTSQKWLLTGANSLPGWSLNGTVWYVASSGNSSFPDDGGHAVQLGRNGKIIQKFTPTNNDVLHYVLSFTLAAQSIDCANNRTALNVTLREARYRNVSRVIYLQENSSRDLWETHALLLGQLGGKEDYVHIEIESVATTSLDNTTCWPLVDAFTVKMNVLPRWYDENMLSNGGFEVGPTFLKNSLNGIILNQEEEEVEMFYSPIQQWSILGTIRYVDSRHYKVPRGKAAVELLSGGVKEVSVILRSKNIYTLNFTIGDANDSCVADFVLYLQAGSSVYNFTMKSNGKGSAIKQSLKFRVEDLSPWETSTISFYSFEETRTRDGMLCGPVLDDISLTGSEFPGSDSYGGRVQVCNGVSVISLVFAFVMMIIVL